MLCQIDNFPFAGEESTPRWIDYLPCQVAQVLKSASGADALVCRSSLITFAIVLLQQTLNAGETIAEQVLEQVQEMSKKQALT